MDVRNGPGFDGVDRSGVDIPEPEAVRDIPGRGDLGEGSSIPSLPSVLLRDSKQGGGCTYGASTLIICPSSFGGPYESNGSGMDETRGSKIGSLALPAIFS